MDTARGVPLVGRAIRAHGRQTNIHLHTGVYHGDVERVRVIGRDEGSHAEVAREMFILQLLQDRINLQDRQFITWLWFSTTAPPRSDIEMDIALERDAFAMLNESQCRVAAAMVARDEPLVITHGMLHPRAGEWN